MIDYIVDLIMLTRELPIINDIKSKIQAKNVRLVIDTFNNVLRDTTKQCEFECDNRYKGDLSCNETYSYTNETPIIISHKYGNNIINKLQIISILLNNYMIQQGLSTWNISIPSVFDIKHIHRLSFGIHYNTSGFYITIA